MSSDRTEPPALTVPPSTSEVDRERSPVPSIGQMSVATTDNTLVDSDEPTTSDEAQVVAVLERSGCDPLGAMAYTENDTSPLEDLSRSEGELSTPRIDG